MFVSRNNQTAREVICEDCYRRDHYGNECFMKAYKHCILQEAITADISRKICHCITVPHYDKLGRPRNLFPITEEDEHLNADGFGTIQCSLLKLGDLVARAKYDGLREVVGKRKFMASSAFSKELAAAKAEIRASSASKVTTETTEKLKVVTGYSLSDISKSEATSSSTSVATEAQADTDIPLFFRRYARKYPFGNVHMALQVGPLVIENGVAQ